MRPKPVNLVSNGSVSWPFSSVFFTTNGEFPLIDLGDFLQLTLMLRIPAIVNHSKVYRTNGKAKS